MFCDIEGSTALARRLGDGWLEVLAAHRALLRTAVGDHGGIELGTEGDGLVAAFRRARDAVAAAADAQRALAAHAWPANARVLVRMGLHTGEPLLTAEGYEGLDMHRAARVMAAGHGGQILLTGAVRETVGERMPPGVAVRDVGEYVLRDLPRPERLFQLLIAGLPATFPPLRASGGRPTNLPRPSTPLLGRDGEVAHLMALLGRRGARLVTLTGPGGVGKTRLALGVAVELLPAHFISFAPVADPALVPATLVRSLGVVDRGEAPAEQALVGALAGEQLLLVLDNLEHVLPAAPLVAELLAACPQLSVLATSREPLRLGGEHVFPVAPLRVPVPGQEDDVRAVARAPAAALFLQRARARDPTFELTPGCSAAVAEVCRRLDGLPLAIELAAARVAVLPPAAMLAHWDQALGLDAEGARDLPPRQRTLRRVFDWSYRLLDDGDRALLRRLAAFPGGFDVDAVDAARVGSGAGLPRLALDAVGALGRLVDRSLVRRDQGPDGEPRFSMLMTVRGYLRERLVTAGEAAAADRLMATSRAALAHRAWQVLGAPRSREQLDRLDRELNNFRAALDVLVADDPERAAELAVELFGLWQGRHVGEGRNWLERALSAGGPALSAGVRARALLTASLLAYYQGDYRAQQRLADQALGVARGADDALTRARALYVSAMALSIAGDSGADAAYRGALALSERLGDRAGMAMACNDLGEAAREAGDAQRAAALYERALGLWRELGDATGVSRAAQNLAQVARQSGDLTRAGKLLREAHAAATGIGDRHQGAIALAGVASVAAARGATVDAATLHGAAEAEVVAAGIALDPLDGEPFRRAGAVLDEELGARRAAIDKRREPAKPTSSYRCTSLGSTERWPHHPPPARRPPRRCSPRFHLAVAHPAGSVHRGSGRTAPQIRSRSARRRRRPVYQVAGLLSAWRRACPPSKPMRPLGTSRKSPDLPAGSRLLRLPLRFVVRARPPGAPAARASSSGADLTDGTTEAPFSVSQQPQALSRRGRRGARARAELAEDVAHMTVDGVLAHREPAGDLGIRQPLGDEPDNLQLAAAEDVAGRDWRGAQRALNQLRQLIGRQRVPARPRGGRSRPSKVVLRSAVWMAAPQRPQCMPHRELTDLASELDAGFDREAEVEALPARATQRSPARRA
jgi:predicted ATPase/class 3 adenylate cyclase